MKLLGRFEKMVRVFGFRGLMLAQEVNHIPVILMLLSET